MTDKVDQLIKKLSAEPGLSQEEILTSLRDIKCTLNRQQLENLDTDMLSDVCRSWQFGEYSQQRLQIVSTVHSRRGKMVCSCFQCLLYRTQNGEFGAANDFQQWIDDLICRQLRQEYSPQELREMWDYIEQYQSKRDQLTEHVMAACLDPSHQRKECEECLIAMVLEQADVKTKILA